MNDASQQLDRLRLVDDRNFAHLDVLIEACAHELFLEDRVPRAREVAKAVGLRVVNQAISDDLGQGQLVDREGEAPVERWRNVYPQVALGNRHHVDVRPIWVRHDADVEQLGQRRNDHGRLEVHVMLVGIGLAHEIALREQEVFEKIAHKHRPPPQAVVRNVPNHRCGPKAGDSVGLTKRGRLSCEISPTSCPRKGIIT